MKQLIIFYILLFFFLGKNFSQEYSIKERKNFRIMFYNVENLFDTIDDPKKRDEEFLPNGTRHWTKYKYYKKLKNISQIITAVGAWNFPEIVGLCEIENRFVLDALLKFTPLKKANYKIIHKDSPDRRGIDVALFYKKDKFLPLNYNAIEINFPFDKDKKTRDILYVRGKIKIKNEILHLFVAHFPSRYGGEIKSRPYRKYVASVLKQKTDSILNENINSKIVIMGDLNDQPENESLKIDLDAKLNLKNIKKNNLYNLSFHLKNEENLGTIKYRFQWQLFDQFIVSGNLLDKKQKIYTNKKSVFIYKNDFLLEEDKKNLGTKPFRTYLGFKFNDGYSDHLPIFLDIL